MDNPSRILDQMRAQLAEGQVGVARKKISELLLNKAAVPPDDHLVWAELCEEAGLTELAMREYEQALAFSGRDSEILCRLLDLYAERGESERVFETLSFGFRENPGHPELLERLVIELRARAMYRRLKLVLEQAEDAGQDAELLERLRVSHLPPESRDVSHILPGDADLQRFLDLFAGRRDVHARQWHDEDRGSGYSPVRQPLDPQLLRNHLLGNVTLGVYQLQLDSRVNFMAFDLDMSRESLKAARSSPDLARSLRQDLDNVSLLVTARLKSLGFDPLLEDSGGKGRHVWCVFSQPIKAAEVLAFGRRLIDVLQEDERFQRINLEFFPKQSRVRGKGLGNLIKLPLGIHRATGRHSCFLGEEGEPIHEPWVRLRSWRRADPELLHTLALELPSGEEKTGHITVIGDDEIKTALPPVSPPLAPLAWTSGHFESDPEISAVLKGCPVLNHLVQKCCSGQDLNYEERKSLKHTLGHLTHGVAAFNWILSRCEQVSADQLLVNTLRGSPASCPKLRRRHAAEVGKKNCQCSFTDMADSYPHPLLHARSATVKEESDETSEDLARAYGAILRIECRAEKERAVLEENLIGILRRLPEPRIAVEGGWWVLHSERGVEELRFESEEAGDE